MTPNKLADFSTINNFHSSKAKKVIEELREMFKSAFLSISAKNLAWVGV